MKPTQAKSQVWRRLIEILDRVQEKNKHFLPEEVEADIDAAIREIRSQSIDALKKIPDKK